MSPFWSHQHIYLMNFLPVCIYDRSSDNGKLVELRLKLILFLDVRIKFGLMLAPLIFYSCSSLLLAVSDWSVISIHNKDYQRTCSWCKLYFLHQGRFCPKSTLKYLTLEPLSHLQKLHHRSTHGLGAYSGPTYSQTDTQTDWIL